MLVRKCIEVIYKHLLPPRPLLCALGTQSAHWYRTKSLDPSPPKRPRSAFNFYVQSNFAEMKEKDPSLRTKDHIGAISRKFQTLSEKEVEKYEQLKLNDIERYRKEVLEFKQQMDFLDKAVEPKMLLSIGKPKKPPNAYLLFRKEYLLKFDKAHIKSNFVQLGKETSEAWKNLSDGEKSKYQKEWERLSEEYKVKLADWVDEMAKNDLQRGENPDKSNGKRS